MTVASLYLREDRPFPTLGGKQVWRDTYLHAGWRIQENIFSSKSRLLDPRDRRWTAGTFGACRQRFDAIRSEQEIESPNTHLVLMVHGIARSTGTFRKLQPVLRETGFDATAISYPSTRETIEVHAKGLSTLLNRLEGTRTVSFVAHSMGALILRRLLAQHQPWQDRLTVGRIVLIAPPNRGAAMAKTLENQWLYKTLYGPAGQQLVPGAVQCLPGLDGYDFAIIAGGRGNGCGFNPLLHGDDDGTVTVAETALAGAGATRLVRSLHANIANHPEAVRAAAAYVEYGRFSEIQA